MILLRKPEEVQNLITELKSSHKSIGFVPTMGALHSGHISLVNQSTSENDFTLVSIFVNPTQFNNPEDLKKYPRTEKQDAALLETAGVDAVFLPSAESLYPNEEDSEHFDFNGLENQMEGKFRSGHFDGVATIVQKFFKLIQPDKAYFGEKDFQQLRIIQELVKQHNLSVEIVPVEIKRESDGLAMSSRNMRLSPEMRNESTEIYRILTAAKSFLKFNSIQKTKEFVKKEFAKTNLKLEYFEIADETSLLPISELKENQKIRGFIAAFAEDIRLIDNMSLN